MRSTEGFWSDAVQGMYRARTVRPFAFVYPKVMHEAAAYRREITLKRKKNANAHNNSKHTAFREVSRAQVLPFPAARSKVAETTHRAPGAHRCVAFRAQVALATATWATVCHAHHPVVGESSGWRGVCLGHETAESGLGCCLQLWTTWTAAAAVAGVWKMLHFESAIEGEPKSVSSESDVVEVSVVGCTFVIECQAPPKRAAVVTERAEKLQRI